MVPSVVSMRRASTMPGARLKRRISVSSSLRAPSSASTVRAGTSAPSMPFNSVFRSAIPGGRPASASRRTALPVLNCSTSRCFSRSAALNWPKACAAAWPRVIASAPCSSPLSACMRGSGSASGR
jgi:hypothetical protein